MRQDVRKALAGLVLLVLTVPSLPGGTAAAREVTTLSGGLMEAVVGIRPPAVNSSVSLTLPEHCYVVDSRLGVAAHGGGDRRSPENVTLDVDDDGTVEWAFTGRGVGAFGHQDRTVDGSTSVSLVFKQPGDQTFTIRLPRGAAVNRATLDICGTLGEMRFSTAKFTGTDQFGMFGLSVAGGADINRDGVSDIAVGAPGADSRTGLAQDVGMFSVLYGPLDGPSTVPDVVYGQDQGDLLGFSVALVRDFAGDGYGEVLAGAPNATHRGPGGPPPNTGVANLYIIDTGTGRLRQAPARTIPGNTERGQMGFSVSEIPDYDGDGRRDVAAGEIMANRTNLQPYLGRVAAIRSGDITSVPANMWGENPYSFFGYSIVSGQNTDFNNDGRPDFAVGAPLASPGGRTATGSVYIFSGPGDTGPVVISGEQSLANFSASMAAGDFNGDGITDLAVGAPTMKDLGRNLGAVLVYSGGPKGIDPASKPTAIWGRWDRARYGTSLACPGDLDADGTDDLLVGAPNAVPLGSLAEHGLVELILTGRNKTVQIWGENPNENFGYSLAAAGDVNRDMFKDFVIGAPTASVNNVQACGRVVVVMTNLSAPRDPWLNVGGMGAEDWRSKGYFAGRVTVPDFSAKLNGVLSNPLPVVRDPFGNAFCDIPVTVHSGAPGEIVISNISIEYDWAATVDVNPNRETGNLTWVLNLLLRHSPGDPPERTIPLAFSADTPGSVRVFRVSIIIDEAPVARPAPSLSLPEDTSNGHLLDLCTLFSDDFQGPSELLYRIEGYTNESVVTVDITDWRWLSVDALNGSGNDNWTGEVRIEVSAQDDNRLAVHTNITVRITPVNDAPHITSAPPTTARSGVRYEYRMAAVDAENDTLSFGLAAGPPGMAVDAGGLVSWTPAADQYNRTFDVTLWASDGKLCATQSFSVTVSGRLDGVRITSSPPLSVLVGEEYTYAVKASTDVENATIALSLPQAPAGMTLLPNGTVRWVPTSSQAGTARVRLAATDGVFSAVQDWNITVLPAGTPPSGIACSIASPAPGSRVNGTVVVSGSASVISGAVVSVEYRIDGGAWKPADGTTSWSFALDTTKLRNGTHTILVRSFDGRNHSAESRLELSVDNPGGPGPAGGGPAASDPWLGWLLGLGLLLAAAATTGFILARRRRSGKEEEAPAAGMAAAAAAPAPAAPVAARAGEEGLAVEDVFLIHLDGRLIHHATRRLATGVDSDILSSMLTAVTSFVKDALARTGDGQLGSLEYGDSKILLERGRWTYLAVVITGGREPGAGGRDTPGLREEMRQALRNVESEYGPVLPQWDGSAASVSGCKRFLAPVTAFSVAAPAAATAGPAEVDVSVQGELEFYQGYVRLKVAVKNNSPAFIMDAALRVMYNDKALRLDRLEPEYPLQGREIMLGNIGIREKKTVGLYLDPQICTESHIDATLTFKDARGEMHHSDMKRKLASVVCPIMYSDQNINVPMLRRLLETGLDQKDAKVFSLPPGLSPEAAFELCKRAVQGHDIRLVREFSDRSPFVGEAWYFGKVRGREDDRLVVKTGVRADTESAEFYVASNSRLVVTGLLAELKNDLNKEYRKEKGAERPVEAMADEERRRRVRAAGSLMDKYAQGEAAPGTTRPPDDRR
ncbi:MAG: hypothetical protein FJ149_06515 [Euryarchaeota archaeon]|nr:hypothetical protein [Euryarchaeota archaeon]